MLLGVMALMWVAWGTSPTSSMMVVMGRGRWSRVVGMRVVSVGMVCMVGMVGVGVLLGLLGLLWLLGVGRFCVVVVECGGLVDDGHTTSHASSRSDHVSHVS